MKILPVITIEFIPDPELGGFTAHIPDIPAYGEGKTEDEALDDLKIGMQAFIEENGMPAALARLNPPSKLRTMNFADLVSHG